MVIVASLFISFFLSVSLFPLCSRHSSQDVTAGLHWPTLLSVVPQASHGKMESSGSFHDDVYVPHRLWQFLRRRPRSPRATFSTTKTISCRAYKRLLPRLAFVRVSEVETWSRSNLHTCPVNIFCLWPPFPSVKLPRRYRSLLSMRVLSRTRCDFVYHELLTCHALFRNFFYIFSLTTVATLSHCSLKGCIYVRNKISQESLFGILLLEIQPVSHLLSVLISRT